MTNGDFRFMKEIGIEPSSPDDPFPRPLSPLLPPDAPLPRVTEEDARWLQNLGVTWEQDPEPGFDLPKTLPEYLARYLSLNINKPDNLVVLDLSTFDLVFLGHIINFQFCSPRNF